MSDLRVRRLVAASSAGFSTIGMIVALVLLGLVMAPLLGTVLAAQRGFVTSRQRAQVTSSARYAHLALTRLIRAAGSSPVVPVTGIDPDPNDDGVFDDIRLRADFNPPDGDVDDLGEDVTYYLRADTMFMRSGDGAEQLYLIGVDSLAFEYFDRDGDPITDRDRVGQRAYSARITLRARSETYHELAERVLVGIVRLRNGR